MRKPAMLAALTLFAFACSMADLPQLVPPLPTPLLGDTATPFPTWTSTLPAVPTYTGTPTLIGQRPSATPTDTPAPTTTQGTPTAVNTIPGPQISPTVLPPDSGFESIVLSGDQIFLGSCGPSEVTFNVQVTSPDKIESVVIFLRRRDKVTGEETGWNRGDTLEDQGDGHFTYVLKSSQLGDHNNNWILYQLVGTDDSNENLARSPVFAESLTLLTCP